MVSIEIDVEIFCGKCGDALNWEHFVTPHGAQRFRVEQCSTCKDAAYKDGYDQCSFDEGD